MNQKNDTSADKQRYDINGETAKIRWHELQRYFAAGRTRVVDPQLDLIEVAFQIQQDNAVQVGQWMESNQLRLVSDDEALAWLEGDAEVWACVVKPWVLVQLVDVLK